MSSALGRVYSDGEDIVRQGDSGDTMYVIQEGEANVIVHQDGADVLIRSVGPGEIIGEMALLEREVRCATVRAKGEVRALTVDRTTFMRQMHEDPSAAFRVVQAMSRRIRELTTQVARLMARS